MAKVKCTKFGSFVSEIGPSQKRYSFSGPTKTTDVLNEQDIEYFRNQGGYEVLEE
jgi:hypothetical protein